MTAKRAILREIVLGLGLTLSEDNTESTLDVLIALFAAGTHRLYLSTFCLHGTHDECGAAQHTRGDLSAPHCKGCDAPCICPRHLDPQAPCWGGNQERRHDPSCALDAGHLGWCGPAMAASEPEAVNLGRRLHTLECGCSARARSHRDLCPSRPFRMIRPEERTASPEPEADREVTP